MKQLNNIASNLRNNFINYFKKNDFKHMQHSSIVSDENDTTLFTVAGMKQFTAWFKDISLAGNDKNIVTVQPCLRIAGKHDDLNNIGVTTRHNTMFEMMGIFSFGKLTKRDTIYYLWNFFTQVCNINPLHLYVTIYKNDDEAFNIWSEIIHPYRIARAEMDTNFWSAGAVGLCGPCSEIFFDKEQTLFTDKYQDVYLEDRFLEICNMVFMSYDRTQPDQPESEMIKLPCVCIDVGAGLERVASVIDRTFDNYSSDTISNIISSITNIKNTTQKRIIADHLRAICFIIADGVLPSNQNQGHILRRLMRRVLSFYIDSKTMTIDENIDISEMIHVVVNCLSYYDHLSQHIQHIIDLFTQEMEDLNVILLKASKQLNANINADDVFFLHNTYGFPLEIALLWCEHNNIVIDNDRLNYLIKQSSPQSQFNINTVTITQKECYNHTQTNSTIVEMFNMSGESIQQASMHDKLYIVLDKTPFYPRGGGQLGDIGIISNENCEFIVTDTITQKPNKNDDTIIHIGYISKGTMKMGDNVLATINIDVRNGRTRSHTSTHLLCDYLSQHYKIKQAGSRVDSDNFTFDVECSQSFNSQHDVINKYINDIINKNIPVHIEVVPKSEASHLISTDKYGDNVRVITIKDNKSIYSQQLCGGTHVKNTGDIINFKIISEKSIKKGIRRFTCETNYIDNNDINIKNSEIESIINTHTHNNTILIECINCNNNVFFSTFDKYKKQYEVIVIINRRESGTNIIVRGNNNIASLLKSKYNCHGIIGNNQKCNMGTKEQISLEDLKILYNKEIIS